MRASTFAICGLLPLIGAAPEHAASGERHGFRHELSGGRGLSLDRKGNNETVLRIVTGNVTGNLSVEIQDARAGKEHVGPETEIVLAHRTTQSALHLQQRRIVI